MTAKPRKLKIDRTNHTPVMNFRAPKELQDKAREVAQARGETLTAVLNSALQEYVRTHSRSRKR